MNTRFENTSRCSANGVATGTMLIVMLAMAASTLFPVDAPAPGATAAASPSYTAQAHHAGQVKRS